MMDGDKTLQNLFCETLDKEFYSFDIISPNNYVNVVFVTAVKTGKSKTVCFDFYNSEISFWNDFDEKFARGLSERGVAELSKIFISEIKQTCYFDFTDGGLNVATVPVKIPEISDGNILKAFKEIYPRVREKFDAVSAVDFTGGYSKKIIYDGRSEFIIQSE